MHFILKITKIYDNLVMINIYKYTTNHLKNPT